MQASVFGGVQLNAPTGKGESASGGLPPQISFPRKPEASRPRPFPLCYWSGYNTPQHFAFRLPDIKLSTVVL